MVITNNILITAVACIAISVIGQSCSPASQTETSSADYAALPALLAGDYVGASSQGQVYHSILPLNVPQFGGDIFYHHISLESLGGTAFQRKIYAFDESRRQMRSTVLLGTSDGFTDKDKLAESLEQLPEASLLRFPIACQFQWTRGKDGYVAEVHRDKCSYESPAFGSLVSPEMTYKLSACGLEITEGIYREDDSPVFPPSTTNNQRTPAGKACPPL